MAEAPPHAGAYVHTCVFIELGQSGVVLCHLCGSDGELADPVDAGQLQTREPSGSVKRSWRYQSGLRGPTLIQSGHGRVPCHQGVENLVRRVTLG